MANTTRMPPPGLSKLPIGTDPASVRQRIEGLEHLLEGLVQLPFLKRKVGLDVLLDVLPVGGDVIGAAMGAYMVWEARNLGMSKTQIARMMGNVGVDFLLGIIPFVGAIPDYFFRSNTRNLRIIRKFLDKHHPATAVVEG